MAERELQRGGGERNTVPRARGLELSDALQHLRSRRAVVEGRPAREYAAVEDAADDHGDAALGAERQELGQRAPVEPRVAAGDEEAVAVALPREVDVRLRLVHAGADGVDRALRPRPVAGALGAGARLRLRSL